MLSKYYLGWKDPPLTFSACSLLSMTSAQCGAAVQICLFIHAVDSDLQAIFLTDLAEFKGIGVLTKLTSCSIETLSVSLPHCNSCLHQYCVILFFKIKLNKPWCNTVLLPEVWQILQNILFLERMWMFHPWAQPFCEGQWTSRPLLPPQLSSLPFEFFRHGRWRLP